MIRFIQGGRLELKHPTIVESIVGLLLLVNGFYLFFFRVPGHALFRVGGVMLIAGVFPLGFAIKNFMK